MLSAFQAAREYLTPTLKSSQFLEKGVLTPEEFVAAGNHLLNVAPTWEWAAGEDSKKKSYLPAAQQFLITKRVPCYARVQTMVDGLAAKEEKLVEGDWVESNAKFDAKEAAAGGSGKGGAGAGAGGGEDGEDSDSDVVLSSKAAELQVADHAAAGSASAGGSAASAAAPAGTGSASALTPTSAPATAPAASAEDDGYEDMSSFSDPSLLAVEDPAVRVLGGGAGGAGRSGAAGSASSSSSSASSPFILRTRQYDISLVYDNYYRTPRVYLRGYNEAGAPLSPEEMLEDVMQDYANKTATIESHPHLPSAGASFISIHPCRHADVMKRMLDTMMANSEGGTLPQVHTYLFLFLKFIASIVPTIEYDYTVTVTLSGGAAAASHGGAGTATAAAAGSC